MKWQEFNVKAGTFILRILAALLALYLSAGVMLALLQGSTNVVGTVLYAFMAIISTLYALFGNRMRPKSKEVASERSS